MQIVFDDGKGREVLSLKTSWWKRLYASDSVDDNPEWSVVGSHPSLGSGVISWHKDIHKAIHNANLINDNGGRVAVGQSNTGHALYCDSFLKQTH